MNKEYSQAVSVEQFVLEIVKKYASESGAEDFIIYGYDVGWLEESEVLGRKALIERKTAARILHQFMRIEMKEADEKNIDSASKLQDLYDCRRCAGHVMQVYTKGIMDGYKDPAGNYIFGMGETVSREEVQKIVDRLFQVQLRERKVQESEVVSDAEMLTAEEAILYLQSDKDVRLVDVRTDREFAENHLRGAQNIPLSAILKNPYIVSERRNQCILVYCEEGYQSKIAANCLLDAGYEKVMYFAAMHMDI